MAKSSDFIQSLFTARARARLTHDKLGEKTGITPRQIVHYEKGQVALRKTTAIRLADALGIEPDSLYIE
ncbi:MAG: helix-turn-helix transcriptional regulator [Proteobacteria bacterium]|nr:helix-turn-helix transcriptional regulator [Pseudomonadota bacterium]